MPLDKLTGALEEIWKNRDLNVDPVVGALQRLTGESPLMSVALAILLRSSDHRTDQDVVQQVLKWNETPLKHTIDHCKTSDPGGDERFKRWSFLKETVLFKVIEEINHRETQSKDPFFGLLSGHSGPVRNFSEVDPTDDIYGDNPQPTVTPAEERKVEKDLRG